MTENQLGFCIVLTFVGGQIIGILIGMRWANWASRRMLDEELEKHRKG